LIFFGLSGFALARSRWPDGDHLMEEATNERASSLAHEPNSFFFNDEINLEIEFTRDSQNKVTGLTLYQNGAHLQFKRQ
jgi:hypothetical protein